MVLQNWMTGCGFTYNATAAELIKNVSEPTVAQLTAVDACGYTMPFVMAWGGMLFLILVFLLAKKWLGEEEAIGMGFNWLFSLAGILIYFILVALGLNVKISLLIGLVTLVVLGFMGSFFGGGE